MNTSDQIRRYHIDSIAKQINTIKRGDRAASYRIGSYTISIDEEMEKEIEVVVLNSLERKMDRLINGNADKRKGLAMASVAEHLKAVASALIRYGRKAVR
jgi:hypothetical protein